MGSYAFFTLTGLSGAFSLDFLAKERIGIVRTVPQLLTPPTTTRHEFGSGWCVVILVVAMFVVLLEHVVFAETNEAVGIITWEERMEIILSILMLPPRSCGFLDENVVGEARRIMVQLSSFLPVFRCCQ